MKLTTAFLTTTALLAPQAASADPTTLVVSALVSSGVTFAGTAVGTALVKIGIGLLYSALGSALSPNGQKAKNGGVQTQSTTYGEQTPQSFILGTYLTAGNAVCPDMSHGVNGDTRYYTRVVDAGDVWYEGIQFAYVDGRKMVFDGAASPDGYGNTISTGSDWQDFVWAKFKDGTQTTADSMLLAKYGSYPNRPWQSDMIGRGIPYGIFTFLWRNEPQIYSGAPQIQLVCKGIKLYDPRKDSTAGGSGSHRFNNQATFEWTENPVVMVYNILRGITLPSGDVYGGGYSAQDLPYSNWAAAMNVCDQTVGSRKRYIAGYEVKIGTPDIGGEIPLSVVEELLKTCSADVTEVGGEVYIRVGEPELPSKFITDDDLLRTSSWGLKPFKPYDQSYNTVHATWPNPNSKWKATEAPPRVDTALLARQNNEKLIADLSLPAVTNGSQVQQLMKAWLADEGRRRVHEFAIPGDGMLLRPLRTLSWDSTVNQYVDEEFEIEQMGVSAETLAVSFLVRGRNAGDYIWTPGEDLNTSTPDPNPIDNSPQTVPGFNATQTTIKDGTGADRKPAILLTWSSPLPGVTAIRFQTRVFGTNTVAVEGSTANVDQGYHPVSEGIVKSVQYQARARLVGPKNTVWTSWVTVTAPDVGITEADFQGSIEQVFLNAGLAPVEILNALPTTGNFEGRTVYLTTDNKLYRFDGTAWTASVETVDLVGQVVASQVADGAITTAKFATGIAPVEIVNSLPTTGNFEGRTVYLTTDNKLYRHTGSPSGSAGFTVATDGADIVANSITGGKIAAGAISTSELAADAVNSSKIAAGAITTDKLAANAVTAGAIATDAVTTDKLAANSVTTGKIATNAITAGLIAAGAINSSHLTTGSAVITGTAQMGNATVGTLTIAGQAVTAAVMKYNTKIRDVTTANTWYDLASVKITRVSGFVTDFTVSCSIDGYGTATLTLGVYRGNTLIESRAMTTGEKGSQAQCTYTGTDTDVNGGVTTYTLRVKRNSTETFANVGRVLKSHFKVQQFKR